jgi:hypothetical protein
MHQRVDALGLVWVVAAQGRVGAAGKPAGDLGLTGAAKLRNASISSAVSAGTDSASMELFLTVRLFLH